jgi:hypothetical protein
MGNVILKSFKRDLRGIKPVCNNSLSYNYIYSSVLLCDF